MKLHWRLVIDLFLTGCILPAMSAQSGITVLNEVGRQIDSLEALLVYLEPSEQVDIYNLLAELSGRTSTSDIITYRRKARQISADLGDRECVAYHAYRMIFHLVNLGLFEEAKEMLDEAARYYEERDPYLYSEILIRYGFYYGRVVNFKQALPSYFKALEIKEQLRDTIGIANVKGRLARIFHLSKNYDRALEYYNSVIQDSTALRYHFVANALHNTARVHLDLGNHPEAKKYFRHAIRIRSDRGIRAIGYAHFARAQIYLVDELTEEAHNELNHALKLFTLINLKGEVSNIQMMLGDLYKKKGELSKAVSFYNKAIESAKMVFEHAVIINAYQRLSECYRESGDHRAAFENLSIYQRLFEERYQGMEAQLISQELEYSEDRHDQQVALLNSQNEIALLTTKRQRVLRNSFIGISALLAALLGLIYLQLRQRRKAQALLEEKNTIIDTSLHEKEDLLKEIHHRVKNNLQIVSSMLHLQGRHVKDPSTLEALRDSRNRVNSMALIHQSLYREDHLKGINAREYIQALTQSLTNSYGVDATRMQISSDVQSMLLDVDTAIPLGLITNELVTNAIKYAFNGRDSGEIHVALHQKNSSLLLSVRDNGLGLPPDFEERSTKSYGYQLIRSLARKLKAEVHTQNDQGCIVELMIKNFKTIPS